MEWSFLYNMRREPKSKCLKHRYNTSTSLYNVQQEFTGRIEVLRHIYWWLQLGIHSQQPHGKWKAKLREPPRLGGPQSRWQSYRCTPCKFIGLEEDSLADAITKTASWLTRPTSGRSSCSEFSRKQEIFPSWRSLDASFNSTNHERSFLSTHRSCWTGAGKATNQDDLCQLQNFWILQFFWLPLPLLLFLQFALF